MLFEALVMLPMMTLRCLRPRRIGAAAGLIFSLVSLAAANQAADSREDSSAADAQTDDDLANSAYVQALVNDLSRRWLSAMPGATANPTVRFVLMRDGSVTDVKVLRSSGVYSTDQAALKMVQSLSPYRPFPPDITKPSLRIRLTLTPRHFLTAEAQGRVEYLNALGLRQLTGVGEHRDPQAAVRSFEEAAAMGDLRAMANLGFLYETGQGGMQSDEKLAAVWYLRAAEAGSAAAALNLARMYEAGRGVSQNTAEALRWYRSVARSSKANLSREAHEAMDRISRSGQ
ncbi:MAG TPA: TonB family protein [Thermoanaerobaculia bacterium]